MALPLSYASNWELLLIFIGRRRRFRVTGNSMYPTLEVDNVVLIDEGAYRHRLPAVGDIVVAYHPHRPNLRVVKRVQTISSDGQCFLIGDNPSPSESTDSRSFGVIPLKNIIGQVTSKLKETHEM
ncbi:MAG: nickel-type superoxide dismutase maturation protease [Chloroflexota bacterium]